MYQNDPEGGDGGGLRDLKRGIASLETLRDRSRDDGETGLSAPLDDAEKT